MKLKSEIQIRSFDALESRVEIASGILETKSINSTPVKPKTFVPKNDWRELNKEEINNINSSENSYTDISIIKIPNSIIIEFKKLKLYDCLNISDINFIQNTTEYKYAIDKLKSFLNKKYMIKNDFEIHNLFFGKPNLSNNTFNSKDNVYIGLHLDSWEKQPFCERKNARNRICINLGKEHRYLQFYNISLTTMASFVGFNTKGNFDINNIYKEFAFQYPNYPVLRIKVNPYEAYIAPTEFIIHDGSNINTIYPDINLVVRGYFNYKVKSKIYSLIFKLFKK
jgi:hypothetical protein